MRPVAALVTIAALLLASCSGDDVVSEDPSETTSPATTATTTTQPTTTTTQPTTTPAPEEHELPGERIEVSPFADQMLGVVGVEAHDRLNVRLGPGVDFEVVLELDPLAAGVIATGHNRALDDGSIWAQLRVQEQTGWANTSFLAHLGRVDDITSEVAPDPSNRPREATMRDLGLAVAHLRVFHQTEVPPQVLVVDGPTVGDMGEVTLDVTGFPDDAVLGERLHVFGQRDSEGFTLHSVERTTLCRRGVTEGGLCL